MFAASVDNKPGGWRDGERQAPAEPARTLYGGRDSYGRDRYGEGYVISIYHYEYHENGWN